jgi:hypothetical protein
MRKHLLAGLVLLGFTGIFCAAVALGQVSGQASTGMIQDTEWDGVKAQLISVKRSPGNTITINFKYTNSGKNACPIHKVGRIEHDNLVEHLYYIDSKNSKKYLVVTDSEKKAIGSQLYYFELAPNESKSGWGKYPAPPADVTKISVYLPGAPPFEDVAITQ